MPTGHNNNQSRQIAVRLPNDLADALDHLAMISFSGNRAAAMIWSLRQVLVVREQEKIDTRSPLEQDAHAEGLAMRAERERR